MLSKDARVVAFEDENVDAAGPDRLIAPGRGRIRDGGWAGKLGANNSR